MMTSLTCAGSTLARASGFADHDGAQLGRGDLGEAAAELADGGAGGRDDDDVFHGGLLWGWVWEFWVPAFAGT
jgi:hypothetical protein